MEKIKKQRKLKNLKKNKKVLDFYNSPIYN